MAICIWLISPNSLVAQVVKNPPAMQETPVRFLGLEDPLEKWMITHSSILPGEFHGQRRLAGYSPWGCKESDTTEWLPLQCYLPMGGSDSSVFDLAVTATLKMDKFFWYLDNCWCVQILRFIVLFISCVFLDKLLNISGPAEDHKD